MPTNRANRSRKRQPDQADLPLEMSPLETTEETTPTTLVTPSQTEETDLPSGADAPAESEAAALMYESEASASMTSSVAEATTTASETPVAIAESEASTSMYRAATAISLYEEAVQAELPAAPQTAPDDSVMEDAEETPCRPEAIVAPRPAKAMDMEGTGPVPSQSGPVAHDEGHRWTGPPTSSPTPSPSTPSEEPASLDLKGLQESLPDTSDSSGPGTPDPEFDMSLLLDRRVKPSYAQLASLSPKCPPDPAELGIGMTEISRRAKALKKFLEGYQREARRLREHTTATIESELRLAREREDKLQSIRSNGRKRASRSPTGHQGPSKAARQRVAAMQPAARARQEYKETLRRAQETLADIIIGMIPPRASATGAPDLWADDEDYAQWGLSPVGVARSVAKTDGTPFFTEFGSARVSAEKWAKQARYRTRYAMAGHPTAEINGDGVGPLTESMIFSTLGPWPIFCLEMTFQHPGQGLALSFLSFHMVGPRDIEDAKRAMVNASKNPRPEEEGRASTVMLNIAQEKLDAVFRGSPEARAYRTRAYFASGAFLNDLTAISLALHTKMPTRGEARRFLTQQAQRASHGKSPVICYRMLEWEKKDMEGWLELIPQNYCGGGDFMGLVLGEVAIRLLDAPFPARRPPAGSQRPWVGPKGLNKGPDQRPPRQPQGYNPSPLASRPRGEGSGQPGWIRKVEESRQPGWVRK